MVIDLDVPDNKSIASFVLNYIKLAQKFLSTDVTPSQG